MNGERGRVVSGNGDTRAGGAVSNACKGAAGAAASTGTTVTFFGGQSMLRLKLGACDAVSSFWPMRVRPGTHTSTTMPNSTAVLASTRQNRVGWKVLGTAETHTLARTA